jgi:hypothetical protein
MNKLFFLFFILVFAACKQDKVENKTGIATPEEAAKMINPTGDDASGVNEEKIRAENMVFDQPEENYDPKTYKNPPIPDACSLLNEQTVGSVLGIAPASITVKSANSGKETSNACFFKFEDPKKLNGGIMVQISTNPIPAEVRNYPGMVIKSKMDTGEEAMNGEAFKFVPFKELGVNGCASVGAGKYQWQIDNKYLFLLAFNSKHEGKDQEKAAIALGQEIIKNFKSKINAQ